MTVYKSTMPCTQCRVKTAAYLGPRHKGGPFDNFVPRGPDCLNTALLAREKVSHASLPSVQICIPKATAPFYKKRVPPTELLCAIPSDKIDYLRMTNAPVNPWAGPNFMNFHDGTKTGSNKLSSCKFLHSSGKFWATYDSGISFSFSTSISIRTSPT